MIAHLRGIVHRLDAGEVTVEVSGVGYHCFVPLDVWEELEEASPAMLWISSYIREDRFDLFGFADKPSKILFEELIKLSGIGPKLGLELMSIPRTILFEAAERRDATMLSTVKGVGKKTAEKLIVELTSLQERKPAIFVIAGRKGESLRHEFDQDAIAALTALGYDSSTALRALKELPVEIKTTEERVAAALRSL